MYGIHHAFHIDVDQLRPIAGQTVGHVTQKGRFRYSRIERQFFRYAGAPRLPSFLLRGNIASH